MKNSFVMIEKRKKIIEKEKMKLHDYNKEKVA